MNCFLWDWDKLCACLCAHAFQREHSQPRPCWHHLCHVHTASSPATHACLLLLEPLMGKREAGTVRLCP